MLELDCSSGVKDLGKVFLNLIRAAYDCIDEFDILKMRIRLEELFGILEMILYCSGILF